MRIAVLTVKMIYFSVILVILQFGCNRNFKDFAAFRGASIGARRTAILNVLKQAKITEDKNVSSIVDRLLVEDEITALLDQHMPSGGFTSCFDRVVPLAYQTLRSVDGTNNTQDAKQSTQWFLNQYGIEATEILLSECERLGGNVSINRIAVMEFKKAQEEEKQRRFEAAWGTFAAWSARPENAQSLSDISTIFSGESKLRQSTLRKPFRRFKRPEAEARTRTMQFLPERP